jgi:hypothetical protein
MKFSDRADAGRRLAGKLAHLKDRQVVMRLVPVTLPPGLAKLETSRRRRAPRGCSSIS